KKMEIEMKKINIGYVIQQVTKSDWDNILKAQRIFSRVNENKEYGFLNIRCPIDRFPEAIIKGLGFEDIYTKGKINTFQQDYYDISILIHLRDTNYKKMYDIAILFPDIGEIFSMKRKCMVDRINKIRKILKKKLDLMKSFKKIDRLSFFSQLTDDIGSQGPAT